MFQKIQVLDNIYTKMVSNQADGRRPLILAVGRKRQVDLNSRTARTTYRNTASKNKTRHKQTKKPVSETKNQPLNHIARITILQCAKKNPNPLFPVLAQASNAHCLFYLNKS